MTRLLAGRSRQTIVAMNATIIVAIAADSWLKPLTLLDPPEALPIPANIPADAVVVELPLGTFPDAIAMYRSTIHRRPTVNGLSGYAPPHYQVLHSALAEGRVEALTALAEFAPILVFVDRDAAGDDLTSRVRAVPAATLLRMDDTHDVLLIARGQHKALPQIDPSSLQSIQNGSASIQGDRWSLTTDAVRTTGWLTATQQGVEEFIGDAGNVRQIQGVVLSLGAWPGGFPRALSVLTSADGSQWEDAWNGDVAAIALRAALRDQRDVPIPLTFEARMARYVRLRQTGWSSVPWALAEFRVMTR
jgi:hypothetical protein